MALDKKTFATLVAITVFAFGAGAARFLSPPERAYVKDLNKDGYEDVVVQVKGGKRYVFLGQEDGRFKRLKDLQDEAAKKAKIARNYDEEARKHEEELREAEEREIQERAYRLK